MVKRMMGNRLAGIILVLLAMVVFLSVTSSKFLTASNLVSILNQSSMMGILAIGMTFIIVSGGMDLSVGSITSLSAMFVADILIKRGISSLPLALFMALLSGLLCGLLNGLLIAYLELPPFLVTMGTMSVFRGLDYLYTGAVTLRGLPKAWVNFWHGSVPWPTVILLVLAVVCFLVIRYAKYGRYVFAIGGNETASALSGINTRKYKVITYMVMGLCCVFCGIVYVGRMSSAEAQAGSGYELDAIAAAAIGGASLSGGKGSIAGAVIGAVILSVLSNGLTLLRVQSFYQTITTGAIIILAIVIDRFANRK